jgi:glycosyltransferase involved in cell wall biosynthesis
VNVTAFLHLNRLTGTHVTGVGRHALEILRRLPAHADGSVQWTAARDDFDACASALPAEIQALPHRSLPWNRKPLELCWKAFQRPRIDRWLDAPDWVYCPAETFVPVRLARLAVTIHDLHPLVRGLPWARTTAHRWQTLSWKILMHRVVRRATVLLAVSEFTKRQIVSLYPHSAPKIRIIGNGVCTSRFRPLQPDAHSPYILVVGGLTEQKGGDSVIELARRFQEMGSTIRIRIAGKSLPHLVENARSLHNIDHLGYVPDPQLPELYGRASAVYFPSRFEGFGLPVVEALACGVPVVSSDLPALVEAGRGITLTCPWDDTSQAYNSLDRILNDPPFASQLRHQALSIRPQLDWEPVVKRLVDALASAP